MRDGSWTRFAVATFLAAAAPAAFSQVIPVLPSIAEDKEARENCLGLLAVLPVMKEANMQALANSPEIYKSGGNTLAVNAVADLARTGADSKLKCNTANEIKSLSRWDDNIQA